MKTIATTEQELQAEQVPTPHTPEELVEYIKSLVEREHTYGTVVYAMSMAAVAAYNYVAHVEGSTGFQASCADLDIIRRTRNIDCPFILLTANDMLFPQYSLPAKLNDAMQTWKGWAKKEAKKLLAETDRPTHPDVRAHWIMLSSMQVDEKEYYEQAQSTRTGTSIREVSANHPPSSNRADLPRPRQPHRGRASQPDPQVRGVVGD